jgi:hypothetical protein
MSHIVDNPQKYKKKKSKMTLKTLKKKEIKNSKILK